MAENQNPMPQASQPMMAPKKNKMNPVMPAVIVFLAVAAFMAVWYFAVK
jgi:hypothetical protein